MCPSFCHGDQTPKRANLTKITTSPSKLHSLCCTARERRRMGSLTQCMLRTLLLLRPRLRSVMRGTESTPRRGVLRQSRSTIFAANGHPREIALASLDFSAVCVDPSIWKARTHLARAGRHLVWSEVTIFRTAHILRVCAVA